MHVFPEYHVVLTLSSLRTFLIHVTMYFSGSWTHLFILPAKFESAAVASVQDSLYYYFFFLSFCEILLLLLSFFSFFGVMYLLILLFAVVLWSGFQLISRWRAIFFFLSSSSSSEYILGFLLCFWKCTWSPTLCLPPLFYHKVSLRFEFTSGCSRERVLLSLCMHVYIYFCVCIYMYICMHAHELKESFPSNPFLIFSLTLGWLLT